MAKSTPQPAPQPAPETELPGVWETFKTVVSATAAVVLSVCRTAEKSVKLVENEVDNLDSEQKLRLTANESKRQALLQGK